MTKQQFDEKYTNFKVSELSCKDKLRTPVPEKFLANYVNTMNILQIVRFMFNEPIIINSGYRTEGHNKRVGGAKNSLHTYNASAIDFHLSINNSAKKLKGIFNAIDFMQRTGIVQKGGLHLYEKKEKSFIHVDSRGEIARW